MFASSFVSKIDAAVEALPLREAIRYRETNVRLTANEFLVMSSIQCRLYVLSAYFLLVGAKNHAEAHANALLEHEFKEGDVVALWFPDGAEKVNMRVCEAISVSIPLCILHLLFSTSPKSPLPRLA